MVIPLPAGSLDPQGPVAQAMADLWWLLLSLGVAVFFAVAVLLAVALFRRRPAAPAESASDGHRLAMATTSDCENRSAGSAIHTSGHPEPSWFGRWIVIGGVAMPLIVLVVVFGATVHALRVVPSSAPSDALVVEVVGHQWWWEVRYPEERITLVNELHIPVGRPIALRLTSADVIHSFWVPELAGKMDLLPDGVNTLVLQADEPGEHQSHCAEFCGLRHADMKLTVVAEPAARFASWVADQQGSSE
ncbi:hypothetical protein BH23ACT8_BH23ACT8_13210 [soil metagenome]|jgi:cytochrome c oxidase subunit 2